MELDEAKQILEQNGYLLETDGYFSNYNDEDVVEFLDSLKETLNDAGFVAEDLEDTNEPTLKVRKTWRGVCIVTFDKTDGVYVVKTQVPKEVIKLNPYQVSHLIKYLKGKEVQFFYQKAV
jgi:hypothetical protein